MLWILGSLAVAFTVLSIFCCCKVSAKADRTIVTIKNVTGGEEIECSCNNHYCCNS